MWLVYVHLRKINGVREYSVVFRKYTWYILTKTVVTLTLFLQQLGDVATNHPFDKSFPIFLSKVMSFMCRIKFIWHKYHNYLRNYVTFSNHNVHSVTNATPLTTWKDGRKKSWWHCVWYENKRWKIYKIENQKHNEMILIIINLLLRLFIR